MTKKGILKLMICMGVLGTGIAVACSTTTDDKGGGTTPKAPHVVNLIDDLVGTYTPINGAKVSITGVDMDVSSASTIESKLVGDDFVFNVGTVTGGITKIEFTENKVINIGGQNYTQQFIFTSSDSATLLNAYITYTSASSFGTTSLDIGVNTGTKKLFIDGVEIANKQ